jgi:hypothetical protein
MSEAAVSNLKDGDPLVFVRDETTKRLPQQAKAMAVEANAIIEDCLKAIDDRPHREVLVNKDGPPSPSHRPQGAAGIMKGGEKHDPTAHSGDRNLTLPTRFGDVGIRLRNESGRFDLMIGSLNVSTSVPWSRARLKDVRSLLSLTRRAVRSIVLHQEGDEAEQDLLCRIAAAIEANQQDEDVLEGTIRCPNPWREGAFELRRTAVPFDKGIRIETPLMHAMKVRLFGGASTPHGGMSPRLDVHHLDLKTRRLGIDPLQWMRMVARGIELDREGNPST